jgi:antitoxin VapB
MALNIKNPEAHRLAQEVADVTGESLTEAVTLALRDRLAAVQRAESFEFVWAEVSALQSFVAALPDRDTRSADEILGYDALGLPG